MQRQTHQTTIVNLQQGQTPYSAGEWSGCGGRGENGRERKLWRGNRTQIKIKAWKKS